MGLKVRVLSCRAVRPGSQFSGWGGGLAERTEKEKRGEEWQRFQARLDVLTALHLWFVLGGRHLDVHYIVARRHVALLALRHLLLGDDAVNLWWETHTVRSHITCHPLKGAAASTNTCTGHKNPVYALLSCWSSDSIRPDQLIPWHGNVVPVILYFNVVSMSPTEDWVIMTHKSWRSFRFCFRTELWHCKDHFFPTQFLPLTKKWSVCSNAILRNMSLWKIRENKTFQNFRFYVQWGRKSPFNHLFSHLQRWGRPVS